MWQREEYSDGDNMKPARSPLIEEEQAGKGQEEREGEEKEMKPLSTKQIAWYYSFMHTKTNWLLAWREMLDKKDWCDDWR